MEPINPTRESVMRTVGANLRQIQDSARQILEADPSITTFDTYGDGFSVHAEIKPVIQSPRERNPVNISVNGREQALVDLVEHIEKELGENVPILASVVSESSHPNAHQELYFACLIKAVDTSRRRLQALIDKADAVLAELGLREKGS